MWSYGSASLKEVQIRGKYPPLPWEGRDILTDL